MDISTLIDRWNTDEGRPYKGKLFDFDSYDGEGEPPLGCMCAQGQVLHVVAGWTPDQFRNADQEKADKDVADLLNISRAHSVLLRKINDTIDGAPAIVLDLSNDGIGKVLGGQWSKLLDFWWHIDHLDAKQWAAAREAAREVARAAAWEAARDAAGAAAREVARDAAGAAAREVARDAAGAAAWEVARDAAGAAAREVARDAAGAAAGAAAGSAAGAAAGAAAWEAARDAARASSEIQGAALMRDRGQSFYFLPLFGFASPDDIPARAAGYGVS